MPHCVAYGCNNKSTQNQKGISFHRFPKDDELRMKWILAVKRKDWEPSKWSRLCSVHFREEDFDRTLQRVQIKENAVPQIFPAITPPPKERPVSVKRKHDESLALDQPGCSQDSPRKQKLLARALKSEKKLEICRKKVKNLNQSKRRLTKKVADLHTILRELKNKHYIQDESASLLTSISKTSDCLVKRATEKTIDPSLKKAYDDRLKAFSITLHYLSPKAYSFVRKTFNTALPHPRTLRKWFSTVKGEPGFSEEILRALKEYASNTDRPAICSLMLDGMSIKKHLEWDGKQFQGTVNVGSYINDDSSTLASEALVFYLVFVNAAWKIPVGYFFVNGVNGEQLSGLVKQCLSLLHDTGVQVASLTCDGTACNLAMATNLGCSFDIDKLVTNFPHPDTKKPVYFFLDPAHMIKLVRNTLGDYKVLLDYNDKEIEWRYIELLHNMQKEEGLHLGNKLSKAHIHYYKQKMKVRLAAQLMSTSVADALKFLQTNNITGFENCGPTIEFLIVFNDLFDILNSKSMKESFNKRAMYPGNIKDIKDKLIMIKSYIGKLKDKFGTPITKSPRKTGFLGFLVCIESAIAMYENYVGDGSDEYPLKYLPMYKISQDHIERLFGYIRSRGGHNNNPTCKQFSGSFKRILLHKELSESSTGNTLVLDKTVMFNVSRYKHPEEEINASLPGYYLLKQQEEELSLEENEEELDSLNELTAFSHIVTMNVVEYIAGYVVRSIFSKLECLECVMSLIEDDVKPGNSLICCKNKGGLIQPSEGAVFVCKVCEKVIRAKLVENYIIKDKNLLNTLSAIVLKHCIGKDIFSEHSNHFFQQDPDRNHFILLLKAVCKRYFTIRLHHYSKLYTENIHKEKVRNHLLKTVTFLGQ